MPENLKVDEDWVPDACTLPTVEQPLRRQEFDDLFAEDVISVDQTSARLVRLELRADPATAAHAARLAGMETACCSFFTFELTITDGRVSMAISTEAAHERVLGALGARAQARLGTNA